MKRRRGRRGFWWWSWLLILAVAGGVGGGYYYGEQRWQEAPKQFLAEALVSFQVRDPFVSKQAGIQIPSSEVADANELEVIDAIKSEEVLSPVVTELDLTRKWGMGMAEAVARLRIALELDLDKSTDQLTVSARLNDPELSAAVANLVAETIPGKIAEIDEAKEEKALVLLEAEMEPVVKREAEARAALSSALAANGIKIELVPGQSLGAYQEIPEVLTAKVTWDSTVEDLKDLRKDQAEYRNYWQLSPRPSLVLEKAEVPGEAVGPALQPFQVRWATYGLTAGLVLGSLLMVVCWKLFP